MESNSKPLYQPWNEDAFQADVFVRGMTWLQRLLYRSLLQAMFFHNTRPYLPIDDDILWVLAGAESQEMWEQNKARILKRFTVCDHNANLLEQKRVTEDWKRIEASRFESTEQGRAGGLKSAEVRREKYGTARPFKPLTAEQVNTPSESFTENGGTRNQVSEVSKEREVSKEKGCNAVVVSCNQEKTADWKTFAILYRNAFKKKAGVEFKDKYFDACLKYSEDVVLDCFKTWASPAKVDWLEANGWDKPLNSFFKHLPEEASDAVEINSAEKEIAEEAAAVQQTAEANQAASIERETQEIIKRRDAVFPVNEASIDELL
jgi:hypothetical protein